MTKTVVILGAGWVGLPLAHKLLQNTLPKCKDGLKVVLVSPNTHFYWNVAAVRGVIPETLTDDQLFYPIAPGFAPYSAEQFEFVLGKAVALDPSTNSVEVEKNDASRASIAYDHLVVATGSHVDGHLPFKLIGTYEETLSSFHALRQKIGAAKTIVIAGAGPTGSETAGEIAAKYGAAKDVTLILGGPTALHGTFALPSVIQIVEKDLLDLGVKLIRNARVESAEAPTAGEGENASAKTIIKLSTGSTIEADVYIPLFGLKTNSSFIPESLLDSKANLKLDSAMRAVGTDNIWGIGDVADLEHKQVTITNGQILHLAATLHQVLNAPGTKVPDYKRQKKDIMIVVMGRRRAGAQVNGVKLWGRLAAQIKGRVYFTNTAKGFVGGKSLRHASVW